MNKNQIQVLFLPFVALVFVFFWFLGGLPFSVGGGFTTLSLSQTDVVSNDAFLNGKTYLMSVSATGAGEYATGRLGEDTKLTDGSLLSDEFTVKLSAVDEKCDYLVSQTSSGYIKESWYSEKDFGFFGSQKDAENWCFNELKGSKVSQGYICSGCASASTRACWDYTAKADTSILRTPSVKWKSTITVESASGSVSDSIGDEKTAVNVGNANVVYATWAGNLQSNTYCTESSKGFVVYLDSGKKVNDEVAVEKYLNSNPDQTFDSCMSVEANKNILRFTSTPNFFNCKANYNSLSNAALNTESSEFAAGDYKFVGSSVQTSYKQNIFYPQLSLRVKADWLGVYVPVTTPFLTNCRQSAGVEINEDNVVTASLKNNGNVDGSIAVSLENCPVSVVEGNTQYYSLSPSESADVKFTLRSASETHSACTLRAYDRSGAGSSSSCSLSIDFSVPSASPTGTPMPTPLVEECTEQPQTPCEGAAWKDYPSCEWDESTCIVTQTFDDNDNIVTPTPRGSPVPVLPPISGETDYTLYAVVGLGVLGLLFLLSRKKGGKLL